MPNKVLAILAIAPIYLAGLFGFMDWYISNDLMIIVGLVMFIFGTWAAVRLYKLPNPKKHTCEDCK